MQSGVVVLHDLLKFVRSNWKHHDAMNLMSPASKPYRRLCKEIAEEIPASQGFYLWGYYEKNGLWRNIYLGKAGLGKTANLKGRILEELKDERCCFWSDVYSEAKLLELGPEVHSNRTQWYKTIKKQWQRSLREAGTTHIVWARTPHLSNDDVKRIEADLIEAMNPEANRQRTTPPPEQVLQEDTAEVFRLFRKRVHEHRCDRLRKSPL